MAKKALNATNEAPAMEAPAMEAPAMEAPAMEAPAMEAPAMEAPATPLLLEKLMLTRGSIESDPKDFIMLFIDGMLSYPADCLKLSESFAPSKKFKKSNLAGVYYTLIKLAVLGDSALHSVYNQCNGKDKEARLKSMFNLLNAYSLVDTEAGRKLVELIPII